MTMPNLLNSSDFEDFTTLDPDWFLGAVGETLRDYCGWHISPVVAETNTECRVGPTGIVLLNSLKVVSVEAVTHLGNVLDPSSYTVHANGWIQLHTAFVANVGAVRPQYNWPSRQAHIDVSFTHGYATVPQGVAEVGYELVSRTLEKPAGVAKDMIAGPYRFQFGEFGPVLTNDQKRRLAPYTLHGIA